jgi:transitional endoplasmic reticulum ATPase
MELRSEVKGQFEKSHRLAKKYYDEGKIAKAREEYLKCAQFMEHLAQLSPPERKGKLLERAKQFGEIATGLKDGTIKVYTSGVEPPQAVEPGAKRVTDGEKARSLILVEKPKVRFDDLAGLEVVKESIKEAIVYPFVYPEEYKYFGVKPGGGILLYGPPGCGKTMLAAAAAAECDAIFINLKVSDIKDKYVGESEKNIKQVFELAQSYERAILFFDEIDALAGERATSKEGHERSLVSELLAQMDALESKGSPRNCLVLAATNRPWNVDIALRRSGRFDATIFIPHPDLKARQKILQLNLKDKPVSRLVSLEQLANRTKGYASAEIVDICQQAARIPLRERIKEKKPRRELQMSDFDQVLQQKKTVLAFWYPRARKELSGTEEVEMFNELIEAANEYENQP